MEADEVRQHWQNWARTYGTDVRATTRSATAKALELEVLHRRLAGLTASNSEPWILEVGCGNGVNCIELAKSLPQGRFDGVDYVSEMVRHAAAVAADEGLSGRTRFFEGDAGQLDKMAVLRTSYDVVFTDRCLINLKPVAAQKHTISLLADRVCDGGHLLMIENSTTTHGLQNRCRNLLGLESRAPADFNLFLDESEIRPHLRSAGLTLLETEDFGSLHDLLLYVLLPSVNDGKIEYEHPLVAAAAKLTMSLSSERPGAFGEFGQNRLFICRKGTG